MELNENEFNRLLSNLTNHYVDDKTIKSLGFVTESAENSHRFMETLFVTQSPSGNKDAEAVYRTMRLLEEVAEKSELPACILMAHLWLISNDLRMHDICDAIELWLTNCKSSDLGRYLLMLANSQDDERVRRRFEKLAAVV
ncbi:MAG: hypothetical protein K8T25_10590 [Planctomycetia bacterium]|nr:hypothetical protein [Planctomycetia bacterium]